MVVLFIFLFLPDFLCFHHGRPRKFFQGGQSRHFAYLFKFVGDATQMNVRKNQNVQCYGNTCKQCFPCKKTLQWGNVLVVMDVLRLS